MDKIDEDNERHRREEQERRAKRKAARDSKSESQAEKERKRREHAQRILQAQNKDRPAPPKQSSTSIEGGSSVFQSLFHQRAEGFLIDLRFRNAPPRPPVGPCFVGLGLDGELTDKWTKYKPQNAVEKQHVWKLHADVDVGLSLAVSAMDWEGCYTDPSKASNKDYKEGGKDTQDETPHTIPLIHPDDEAIINWKGSLGDTEAEKLQQKRDLARAAARLAVTQGYGSPPPLTKVFPLSTTSSTGAASFRLKKKNHLQSRILDEKTPNFMKKTTYLTNDSTSVHRFTSLAHSQEQRARDVDRAMSETKSRYTEMDLIEKGFQEANSWQVVGLRDSETNLVQEEKNVKKKKRVHPTKKDVFPVWDLPLLPDFTTWGQTYTHVVLDNPPKTLNDTSKIHTKSSKGKHSKNLVNAPQLENAIVADVTRQAQNDRMACTVWVPVSSDEADLEDDAHNLQEEHHEKGESYQAVQRYDLDVVPLRDSSGPPVHFVFMINPARDYVGYHMVGSRIQLSTGRPIVLSTSSNGESAKSSNSAEVKTDKSVILRRSLEDDEKEIIEKKMAEVDIDLAEKYGLFKEKTVGLSVGQEEQSAGDQESPRNDDQDSDEDAF